MKPNTRYSHPGMIDTYIEVSTIVVDQKGNLVVHFLPFYRRSDMWLGFADSGIILKEDEHKWVSYTGGKT